VGERGACQDAPLDVARSRASYPNPATLSNQADRVRPRDHLAEVPSSAPPGRSRSRVPRAGWAGSGSRLLFLETRELRVRREKKW